MTSGTVMASPAWRIAPQRLLSLDRPRIMGVLNVTPDSFSDGGRHRRPSAAVGFALRLIEEGADVIDVGGESTRPGSTPVPAAEQIDRVLPVIAQLRRDSDVLISIDTTSSDVARAALDAGADIINDISAGRDDPAMLPLAALRGCGLVLMHRARVMSGESYSDRYLRPPAYDNVVEHVSRCLAERVEAALASGIDHAALVIDPGLGFGKSVEQNFQLIAELPRLAALGCPVLGAASRKSFIGAVTGQAEPASRVMGSVAVGVVMWMAGVRLFRVHDVRAHRQALAVAAAITESSAGHPR